MKPIKLNEVKNIELEILKDVAHFCDENDLCYYLAGGTLLGAIRHKGFIPWDDDIDIIMPRADYEKFLMIYGKKANSEYKILSPYDDCKYTYAKVYNAKTIKIEKGIQFDGENYAGIDIDIFPTDGLPDDDDESNKIFRRQKLLFLLYSFAVNQSIGYSFKGKCFHILCKLIGAKRLISLINSNAKKTKYEDSNFIGVSVIPYYGNKEKVGKQGYEKQLKVKFEDDYFSVPSSYDEYLSNLYGDYMELPPLEKRITHHDYEVFWK